MQLNKYLVLAEHCDLKWLETPFIYDIYNDQLYEVDSEAFEFFRKCTGEHRVSELLARDSEEMIKYGLEEGLLKYKETASYRSLNISPSPQPSLRYLLIHITTRCNLACKHCYLGTPKALDMRVENFKRVVEEFEAIKGLKLMITGGEPLLHRRFWKMLEYMPERVRKVLLSNGTLIDIKTARGLKSLVNEVQVSIDGIASHDFLRGKGSFEKSICGVKNLLDSEVKVSIATMIHSYNLGEFEEMDRLFKDLGVSHWTLDVPCIAGNLEQNREFVVDLEDAAGILSRYGFGGGAHESTGDYTCGSHLCAVMPNGDICKCGFFWDKPVGSISEGLLPCWERVCREYLWSLKNLRCKDCPVIENCHGGCRYRALQYGDVSFPDPLRCFMNNINPETYL